jgi:hypothetical protein
VNPFLAVLAVLLVGYFALFVLQRDSRIATLLVIAMFVTRFTVDIAGFSVRLEMFAAALAGVGLLLRHDARRRLTTAAVVSVAAVAIWLVSGTFASAISSPEFNKSLGVLIWCALSFLGAIWVSTHPGEWPKMLAVGVWCAVVAAVLAVVAWTMATLGISTIGVQDDPTYGGWAAFVASIEANVLAGLLCLWGIVAAWNPGQWIKRTPRTLAVLLAPVAILTTHTRAALVALLLGLFLVFIFRRTARPLVIGAGILGGGAAAGLILRSSDAGFSKFSSLLDTSTGTGGLRRQINELALHEWLMSSAQLQGLGWNSFGQRHLDPTQPFKNLPSYIGNLPLQILYDGGVVAAAAVAVAVTAVIYIHLRARHLGLVLALALPYLLFSIATSVLWLFETWFWVGLAWGAGTYLVAGQRSKQREVTAPLLA